jgi:hypothetical protein
MATYRPNGLVNGAVLPHVAEALFKLGASQCWTSQREANMARGCQIANGLVDECHDGTSKFFRIWHAASGAWLNAYA